MMIDLELKEIKVIVASLEFQIIKIKKYNDKLASLGCQDLAGMEHQETWLDNLYEKLNQAKKELNRINCQVDSHQEED